MKIFKSILIAILFFTIVTGLGYGLFVFLTALIEKLNSIDSDLSKTIVGSSLAVLGAAITIAAGKILEQRIKIKQEVREKKVPVYEEQMEAIFRTEGPRVGPR